jgi:hypothetical protein
MAGIPRCQRTIEKTRQNSWIGRSSSAVMRTKPRLFTTSPPRSSTMCAAISTRPTIPGSMYRPWVTQPASLRK